MSMEIIVSSKKLGLYIVKWLLDYTLTLGVQRIVYSRQPVMQLWVKWQVIVLCGKSLDKQIAKPIIIE